MDNLQTGLALVSLLLVLLAAGMPIGFALFGVGLLGIFLQRGWPTLEFLLSSFPYSSTAHLAFIVLPLFLFMGHMAFAAGVSGRAFRMATTLFGHVSGGLAIATIFACSAFAMVSGSSVATASIMARVAVPEMLARGYSQRLAAGCVAVGGTLGVLIPPSGILVIYSIATNVSLPDLFIAALIPGFATALAYAVAIYLMVRLNPRERSATTAARSSRGERIRALALGWEVILLFAIVMGTMYFGIATPTEAAAFGAAAALVFAITKGRRSGQIVWRGLVETGVATSSIFLLVVGAGLFSTALATTQIPQQLAAWAGALDLPPQAMLFLLMIPFLILGCFVDAISMILLTMPILFPIVEQHGIDPVLFGILVTKTTEIGAITPPVGLNAFVVKNTVPELDLGQVFRGIVPFVFVELLLLALLILFPQIALGLVN